MLFLMHLIHLKCMFYSLSWPAAAFVLKNISLSPLNRKTRLQAVTPSMACQSNRWRYNLSRWHCWPIRRSKAWMHGPVCGLNYLSTYMKRGPYSHVNSNSILPTYIDITDIAHSLKCCLPVDKRPTCTERVELSFTCRQGLSEILFLGSVLKDTSKALQFIV